MRRDLTHWQSYAGLAIPEVSAITNLSQSLLRKEIKAGRIKAIRVGERRLVIPVSAVKALMEGNAVNE